MSARRDGRTIRFRFWAPEHVRLELVFYADDGRRTVGAQVLRRVSGGFFETVVHQHPQALFYKVRVDGAGPYPDPASRSQPFGVHGVSEVEALSSHRPAKFGGVRLEDLVIYELHVGTATDAGTFDGLIPILPELARLGVTAIELMPVASFPGRRNWGYDGVSAYAPAAVYGGPAGLRRLVDAAHAAGLGILLDVVYNHFGPDGNYLGCFARRHFTKRFDTPWGDALDLRQEPVRDLLCANAAMWVGDYGVDGLRLDATHALFDERDPHMLQEIAERARAAAPGREVVIIAEDERNDARLVAPLVEDGFGLDAVWADDFHHAVRRAFAGDDDGYYADYTGGAAELARILTAGWLYEGQLSRFRSAPRGTPAGATPAPRFVHCIQNHDQIGNRAFGERLSASVSDAAFRAMSALLLLSPFTPLLFMGQEWNAREPFLFFTDHEPDLGRRVRAGRRAEFARFAGFDAPDLPDPQADDTFTRSRLDRAARTRPEGAAMLRYYEALLALRRTHPALRERARDAFGARAAGEALVLARRGGGRTLEVAVALPRAAGAIDLGPGAHRIVLSSDERRFGGEERARLVGTRLELPAESAVVVERV